MSEKKDVRKADGEGNVRDIRRNGKRIRKLNAVMRRKLAGLFLVVVLALLVLLIRMTYISAVDGERYAKAVLARSQSQFASQTLAYKRGDILDRNGTVLATSEKRYNVILDPSVANAQSGGADATVAALVSVFGVEDSSVRSLLEDEATKDSQYQVVKSGATIEDKQAFSSYCESHSGVRGVWFEETYVRTYPRGSLAGEVLGFVYDTDKADWGIEGYYNYSLSGVNGRRYGYWDSGSEIEQTIAEPVDGDTLVSTLDAGIQEVCEKTIADFGSIYKNGPYSTTKAAKHIGVVVMNPDNGAIYAMASNEGYDPNHPRDLRSYYTEDEISAMTADQQAEKLNEIWKNFCVSDSFEPGSVFKPVTMASALESGAVSSSDTFVCDGGETVAGVRIKCSNTDGHGEESLKDVIKNSCNDAMMQIGAKLGVEGFSRYQQMFGFGSRTGIDLSGEAAGIISDADTMGSVDLACASFGQGFNVTMLQEAAAVSSIVNGGNYYKPHVVSQIRSSDGTVKQSFDGILMKQTVASDVSGLVKSYMKASVDEGTSQYAKVDGYSMGGKTGTAQKIPRGNGKYLDSWIGFAPYSHPKVVIYVVVDEPNVSEQADNRYPQWIARDILKQILPYLGIEPDEASDADNVYLSYDYSNPTGDQKPTADDEDSGEPDEEEDTDTYYYDENGDRRNSEGHLVDSEGYLINSDSQYVDQNDNVIDESQKIRAGGTVSSGDSSSGRSDGSTPDHADTAADTNVPEPKGTEAQSDTEGGNTMETDGYTNDETGLT